MQLGNFYGVGTGPGDPGLITVKAVEILKQCDVIFYAVSRQSNRSVSGNVINSIPELKAQKTQLTFAMKLDWQDRLTLIKNNAELIFSELAKGKNCVFATIGDPMTYSTYGYLIGELKKLSSDLKITTVPGVNSWSALAASVNQVLVEDDECLKIIPSHIKNNNFNLPKKGEVNILLKTYRTRNAIIEKINSATSNYSVIYGSHIGLDEEYSSNDCEEISNRNPEYLSMMIVRENNNQ